MLPLSVAASDAQGKPAQAKGQDRLGGRSRIKVEEDNPYLYLSEVCLCVPFGLIMLQPSSVRRTQLAALCPAL